MAIVQLLLTRPVHAIKLCCIIAGQTQTQNNLFVTQQQKTHTHVTKIYKYIIIYVVRIRRPALRSMLIAIMQATGPFYTMRAHHKSNTGCAPFTCVVVDLLLFKSNIPAECPE